MVVISLTHANAHSVVDAIETLQLGVQVAVASDTTLILHGPERNVEYILTSLITELDVPDGMSDERDTEYMLLPRIPDGDFIDLIHAAAPGQRTRIAFDEGTRLLVVHATTSELKAIRRVVDEVSKPPASLTVSFYFIRGRIGAEKGNQTPLPKGLADVGATLLEHGFSELSLMSPVIISVTEGQAFEQQSVLRTMDGNGVPEDLHFHVQGRARLNSDSKIVQMQVEANVHGEYQTPDWGQTHTQFETNTTIAVRLGRYVVLAAAPSSSASGSAIAVVVTVSDR